jgi:hypothetical protein
MAGNTEFFIPQKAQDALLEWCKQTVWGSGNVGGGSMIHSGFSHRQALERIDREYYRDNIYTEDKVLATIANMRGDKKKLQDIVIPLCEAQTETQLAYLTSVFLTGYPMFGVTADKDNIDGAKQYQAVIAENQIHGGWVRQLMIAMHDSLKYFGVVEKTWCKEMVPSFDTTVDQKTGDVSRTKQVVWEGNTVRRISPYNVFWDRRVPITEIHTRGEYAGYVTMESRVTLKQYIEEKGLKMNIDQAYTADLKDSIPNANQTLFFIPDFFWNSLDNLMNVQQFPASMGDFSTFEVPGYAGKTKIYKNIYYKVVRYFRMVPRDWGLQVPMSNQVQIWKIVTVNDQVIIECERQNNIHGYIPLIFFQPTEDGLQFNNRSFAQKQIPMQDIASALLNGALQAMRRAVGDRLVYDPSRIAKENIASESPSARIPVRPAGYGGDLNRMVYKIPYEDHVTPPFMQVAKEITQYSNMISGQNPAQQGQFVKGNKTQSEYEDVQNHSSGRQRKTALMIEDQLMVPLKEMLKADTLQYQTSQTVYNYLEEAPNNPPVKVDPLAMRKAVFSYKMTDGLLPEDKIINDDMLGMAMQVIGSSPQLQASFDVGAVFSYLMKTKNVNIEQFRITNPAQVQQNMMAQQQAGQPQTTAEGAPVGPPPRMAGPATNGAGAGVPRQ